MSKETFVDLIGEVTQEIGTRAVNHELEAFLNDRFPADGSVFKAIESACHDAIDEGWMCDREHGGIRFGRVVKPGSPTRNFSVDVVQMKDVAGPHHRHPNGEIDMIMPLSADAQFDGHGRGWMVYEPDSAHSPTVTQGDALVLYLLPDGAIEFSRTS